MAETITAGDIDAAQKAAIELGYWAGAILAPIQGTVTNDDIHQACAVVPSLWKGVNERRAQIKKAEAALVGDSPASIAGLHATTHHEIAGQLGQWVANATWNTVAKSLVSCSTVRIARRCNGGPARIAIESDPAEVVVVSLAELACEKTAALPDDEQSEALHDCLVSVFWGEFATALADASFLDWPKLKALIQVESLRAKACLSRPNGPEGSADSAVDESAFRPASEVRPEWFKTHKQFKGFLDRTPAIQTKRKGQRLLVHTGDLSREMNRLSEAAFKGLDGAEPKPIIGVDLDIFVRGAAERQKQIQTQKKKSGK